MHVDGQYLALTILCCSNNLEVNDIQWSRIKTICILHIFRIATFIETLTIVPMENIHYVAW